jgi:hypothetical protein
VASPGVSPGRGNLAWRFAAWIGRSRRRQWQRLLARRASPSQVQNDRQKPRSPSIQLAPPVAGAKRVAWLGASRNRRRPGEISGPGNVDPAASEAARNPNSLANRRLGAPPARGVRRHRGRRALRSMAFPLRCALSGAAGRTPTHAVHPHGDRQPDPRRAPTTPAHRRRGRESP